MSLCPKERKYPRQVDIAAAWFGELIFDILVFGMTLFKTLTLPRTGEIGLLTMLMRDGANPFQLVHLYRGANYYHLP